MRRDIIRLNWMAGRIPEIWIMLNFEHCFREFTIRLVHPDQLRSVWKRTAGDVEVRTFPGQRGLNSCPLEDRHQRRTTLRRFDQKPKKLTRSSRAHGVCANRIEPAQPLLAIVRRMVQQEKRGCR